MRYRAPLRKVHIPIHTIQFNPRKRELLFNALHSKPLFDDRKELVLLIGGLVCEPKYWDKLTLALISNGFHVVRMANRGVRPNIMNGTTAQTYTTDCALDWYDLLNSDLLPDFKKLHLIGNDQGTQISLKLIDLAGPKNFSRVVLESPILKNPAELLTGNPIQFTHSMFIKSFGVFNSFLKFALDYPFSGIGARTYAIWLFAASAALDYSYYSFVKNEDNGLQSARDSHHQFWSSVLDADSRVAILAIEAMRLSWVESVELLAKFTTGESKLPNFLVVSGEHDTILGNVELPRKTINHMRLSAGHFPHMESITFSHLVLEHLSGF